MGGGLNTPNLPPLGTPVHMAHVEYSESVAPERIWNSFNWAETGNIVHDPCSPDPTRLLQSRFIFSVDTLYSIYGIYQRGIYRIIITFIGEAPQIVWQHRSPVA